jgi:hypothetical protein
MAFKKKKKGRTGCEWTMAMGRAARGGSRMMVELRRLS